jgi:hypothetical protein
VDVEGKTVVGGKPDEHETRSHARDGEADIATRLWLCLLGFPIAAALSAKAAHLNAWEIFLSAAGVVFLFNLVDWLILDWLIVCTINPKFMVLSGTEGMAGYKNYVMHFRGFLIGTVLAAMIGLLITIILIFL